MTGKLTLCATPIGNLEDITLRVLRILREADLIAAEDTRNSLKLLTHFDIHTPLTSYHEYNKIEKGRILIKKMQEGCHIALVTDAGTPGISDPGEELVRMCWEEGIEVESLPGPSAVVTALTVSGLATRRFAFEAFLPADKKERKRILTELREETRTIILYEAPHHLLQTLQDLADALGDRKAVLCRELTKLHETITRATLQELISQYTDQKPLGECVLVIEGMDPRVRDQDMLREWQSVSIEDHVAYYEKQGMDRKAAMKQAAVDRGVSKREVYQACIQGKNAENTLKSL